MGMYIAMFSENQEEEADRHSAAFRLFWRTLLFDRKVKRNGDRATKS